MGVARVGVALATAAIDVLSILIVPDLVGKDLTAVGATNHPRGDLAIGRIVPAANGVTVRHRVIDHAKVVAGQVAGGPSPPKPCVQRIEGSAASQSTRVSEIIVDHKVGAVEGTDIFEGIRVARPLDHIVRVRRWPNS